MSQKIGQEAGSEKTVMMDIRHLGASKNTSLQPTFNRLVNDGSDLKINQLGLKILAGKGLLMLDDGNYKIKENARRRRSRSGSRQTKSAPKRRSRSRKRSGSKRRKRSGSGRRRRRRSSSGKRRRRSSSGRRRKRSTSKRRRSRSRRQTPAPEGKE